MPDAAWNDLSPETQARWQDLLIRLTDMAPVVVAFSGGVDSALLCAAAQIAAPGQALAVNVVSPVNPAGEDDLARDFAHKIGIAFEALEYDDLQGENFAANPPDRCYHCKGTRLRMLQELANRRGFRTVAEGSNADDRLDYRPGSRAVAELGVRSPLAEAGLTKAEIRALARALGLPVWDRPSAPCLATRFPYGSRITREGLRQVAEAEAFLQARGFAPLRVRHLGDSARIEIAPADFARLAALHAEVVAHFRALGFQYVSLDLQGYRMGSLNEVLKR